MKLSFAEIGNGPPLIILHGLFGSGKNWASIARALENSFRVFAVDQRNHGESPHAATHTLRDLTDDLSEFVSTQNLDRPILLAHSMGGLAAMSFALENPSVVFALAIVDIVPKPYAPRHESEFNAMRADISKCKTRSEVDQIMSAYVPDTMTRQFIQMNLGRDSSDRFQWKVPVETLAGATFMSGFTHLEGKRYEGPTQFVVGGQSDYVSDSDAGAITRFFPRAKVAKLPDAGHWLHYSHQKEFLAVLNPFLTGVISER